MDRVKTKRRERLNAEHEASILMGANAKEFRRGERKKERLKREIDEMWIELENTFNINQITSMENNLKAEKLRLLELYQDTQGQAQVRKAQNAALDEKEAVDIKLKGKVNKHSNELREAKQ